MTDEQRKVVTALGKRGQTIVREQKGAIVGHGLLKPREAEQRIAAALPFAFNSHHFLRASQSKAVRPQRGDPHPEPTDERYCLYDELSGSYGYTDAGVKWLIKHCATDDGFHAATGRSRSQSQPGEAAASPADGIMVVEAAHILGCHETTVWRLLAGELATHREQHARRRLSRAEVDRVGCNRHDRRIGHPPDEDPNWGDPGLWAGRIPFLDGL